MGVNFGIGKAVGFESVWDVGLDIEATGAVVTKGSHISDVSFAAA